MFAITANLETEFPARCPICQRPLIAQRTWAVDSLCFCRDCALACTSDAIGLEVDVALGCAFRHHYPRVHGLLLWAPPLGTPTDQTAAQMFHETSVYPYVISRDMLEHAGRIQESRTDFVEPQSRKDYRPRHRSTPTVFAEGSDS